MERLLRKKTIMIIIAFFSVNTLIGQNLLRRISLGAGLIPVKNGLKVSAVFPNTNAEAWGLKVDDIIESFDGVTYNSVSDLVQGIKAWKANESIELIIQREKKKFKNNVAIRPNPEETSAFGSTEYGEVAFDGGYLRTILTCPPTSVKNPPVIFFMQGVGCASIDYYSDPQSTVKLLVDDLVKHGIAVFRVEKPGMGDSNNQTPCLQMDYSLEFDAFDTALSHLKSLGYFDNDKIFLFGESLSSITAPYLAKKHNVKGIVNWGGIAGTWFDYYMSIQINQKRLLGQSESSIQKNYKEILPFAEDYYKNKLTPFQLKRKGYDKFVERYFRADSTRSGLHHYKYFQILNDRNSLEAYKKVDCHVLSLAGKHDIHTASTQWAIDITNAVNSGGRELATYKILPETTHHYYKVPSIEIYNSKRRNGELTQDYMSENFDNSIAQNIANWINDIKKQ